ncbi:MAG: hypothetical protein RR500_06115 [Bacilli bacterium]
MKKYPIFLYYKIYELTILQIKKFYKKINTVKSIKYCCNSVRKIRFKRGFLDLYVIDIETGEKIPTIAKGSNFQKAQHTFVPIKGRMQRFRSFSDFEGIGLKNLVPSVDDIFKANEDLIRTKDYKEALKIRKQVIEEMLNSYSSKTTNEQKVIDKQKITNLLKEGKEKLKYYKMSYNDRKEHDNVETEKRNNIKKQAEEFMENAPKPVMDELSTTKDELVIEKETPVKTEPVIEKKAPVITKPIQEKPEIPTKKPEETKENNQQKIIKNDNFSLDYWASKIKEENKVKQRIVVSSTGKTISQLASELEALYQKGFIGITNIEGVEINTELLQKKEEIIEYFYAKSFGRKATSENVLNAINFSLRKNNNITK